MTNSRDRDVAYQVAHIIAKLDKLVLSEDPIARIEIVRQQPSKEDAGRGSYFRYVTAGERIGERYVIFIIGIEDFLQEELRQKRHLALVKNRDQESWEETPLFTREELLIAIASHEVRHRLQNHAPITIFSQQNTSQVVSLKLMGAVLAELFERGLSGGNIQREYDAKVIEYLVAKEAHSHFGKFQLEKIAEVIKTTPGDFINK